VGDTYCFFKDKTRQGLERNSDEMEDMFALSPMMQDEEDQGVSESLNKVIKSLEVVRDRHAASVDDLRCLFPCVALVLSCWLFFLRFQNYDFITHCYLTFLRYPFTFKA